MRDTHWRKPLLAATVIVSLSLLLSGCVATAGSVMVRAVVASRVATADRNKPHTGSCWRAAYADVDGFADWNGDPAVSCTQQHQLYTFSVAHLQAVHRGKLFNAKDFVPDLIENDAYDTCDNQENAALSNLSDTSARIYILPILPAEKQWNDGARWVRCDVGVLAVGSSVAHPSFEDLPDRDVLYTALKNAPSQFDFCVNDPGGLTAGGPKGKNAVYEDCRNDPEWKLLEYQNIPAGIDDAYPTKEEMRAQFEADCERPYSDARHVTYAYYPSADDWQSGYTDLECWVGRR